QKLLKEERRHQDYPEQHEAHRDGKDGGNDKDAFFEDPQIENRFTEGKFARNEQQKRESGKSGSVNHPGCAEPISALTAIEHNLQQAQARNQKSDAGIINSATFGPPLMDK